MAQIFEQIAPLHCCKNQWAYLPPAQARVGNELAVSYMEELYPVTVVSAVGAAMAM